MGRGGGNEIYFIVYRFLSLSHKMKKNEIFQKMCSIEKKEQFLQRLCKFHSKNNMKVKRLK